VTKAERLRHREGSVDQVGARRDEGQIDTIPGEGAQSQKTLGSGDTTAGDDDANRRLGS
jgi:hypothetical protein